ncbi:hypothetical protein [Nocardia sp. alder85J]|uniref:hypothetical protein n=1 Tax=Nocardia sp. alder85J TaxID=2862949 RepID=UPI001CD29C31|nr:hypothetical protein [Nocardia sp. alder85J]MCX4094346.1 hypothetical protein [Nocardia sp. alder85J]
MSTTEGFPTTWVRCALLAAVVGGLAGCAEDGRYTLPDTTMRVPGDPVLRGVVSADGVADIAVDIGATRPVTVTLAEVAAGDCGPGDRGALSAALTRFLPVGTPVLLVRSAAAARPRTLPAFVYVRPADSPAAASSDPAGPTGPSVNELVLAAGLARLTPAVDRAAAAAPVDGQIATAAAGLPAPDRGYLPALAAAETAAWQAGAGVLPDCVARQHDLDGTRAPAPATNTVSVVAAHDPAPAAAAPATAPGDTVRRTDIRIDIQIQRPAPQPRPRPWCRWTDRC